MDNYVLANEVLLGNISLHEALSMTGRPDDLMRVLKIRRSMRLAIMAAFYYRMVAKYVTNYNTLMQAYHEYQSQLKEYHKKLNQILKQYDVDLNNKGLRESLVKNYLSNYASNTIKSDVKSIDATQYVMSHTKGGRLITKKKELEDKLLKIGNQAKEAYTLANTYTTSAILVSLSDILDYLADSLGE